MREIVVLKCLGWTERCWRPSRVPEQVEKRGGTLFVCEGREREGNVVQISGSARIVSDEEDSIGLDKDGDSNCNQIRILVSRTKKG